MSSFIYWENKEPPNRQSICVFLHESDNAVHHLPIHVCAIFLFCYQQPTVNVCFLVSHDVNLKDIRSSSNCMKGQFMPMGFILAYTLMVCRMNAFACRFFFFYFLSMSQMHHQSQIGSILFYFRVSTPLQNLPEMGRLKIPPKTLSKSTKDLSPLQDPFQIVIMAKICPQQC